MPEMSEAHKKLEKSIGCGTDIESDSEERRKPCSSTTGDLCFWCQVKRDVCDELTAARVGRAILEGENGRLKELIEGAARLLETIASGDGSGHADLGRGLRERAAAAGE